MTNLEEKTLQTISKLIDNSINHHVYSDMSKEFENFMVKLDKESQTYLLKKLSESISKHVNSNLFEAGNWLSHILEDIKDQKE